MLTVSGLESGEVARINLATFSDETDWRRCSSLGSDDKNDAPMSFGGCGFIGVGASTVIWTGNKRGLLANANMRVEPREMME